MPYTTFSTQRSTADSAQSRQVAVYKKSDSEGFVLTGATVNSQTAAFIDVSTTGQATAVTSISGGVSGPTITSITYLDSENQESTAVAVSTTGGNIRITGSGFSSSDTVYINNLPATKTFVNATTMFANVSSGITGNITLAIFNTANIGSLSNSAVRLSGAPAWVTAAALTAYNGIAANIALSVTTDTTVTYSLKAGSGSLPTGITLNSAGYLAGTPTGYTQDTVVTFTLLVTDTEGQAAQRTFNFTIFLGDTYFPQTTLLLQGDVGTTFISDASTNNFLVSRVGDTRPNRMSPYWPGGWSGYFPANGSYLTGSNAIFNISSGTLVWSFECWIYPISSGTFFAIGSGGAWGNSFNCEWGTTTNKFIFNQSNGSSAPVSITSSGTYTSNQWYHYAVTKDGSGVIRLFVNGSQQGTQTYTSAVASGTTFVINGRYDNNGLGNTGGGFYISNLCFVRNTALYTANFTPGTTSLTTSANVALLALRDPILVDDSPYGHTITRTGNASLTTFSPFNTTPHTITPNSYSVYFDGTTDTVYTANASTTATAFGSSADFTMEFWLYPLAHDADFDAYVSAGTATIGYYPGTGRGIIYNVADGSAFPGTYKITSGSSAPALNTWSHIAAVRSGGVVKLYLNGTQIGNSYTDTFNHGNGQIIIGSNSTGGSAYQPNCYISNFRIIKGTAVYTANFTIPTAPLTAIANTSFLSGNSSSIADNGPNALALTINGNSRASVFNPFGETVTAISNYTWSAASYGSSAYFDGSGDYLTVPSSSELTLGTQDHTIEFWLYLDGAQSAYATQWKYASTAANLVTDAYWFQAGSNGGGIYTLLVGAGGSWGVNISAGATYYTRSLNNWTHVAWSRSGSTWRLFWNGEQVGTATYSGSIAAQGSAMAIGTDSGTNNTKGYISNFRLVKGTALYTGPFVPPAAPLTTVANVSLLTLQSDIGSNSIQFVDQSPNNHIITRNGNASQGSYSPLNPTSWSAYFDGTGDYLSIANNSAFAPAALDFTIEAWVYINALTAGNQTIFGQADSAGSVGSGIYFYACNAAGFPQLASPYGGSNNLLTSTTAIAIQQWNHIAVARYGAIITIYVNGIASGTINFGALALTASTQINSIGRNGAGNFEYLNGYISNFRFVKGTALYTANFTPATTTLSSVTNTSLLCLNSPTLTDNGPNNFTITRNGDTRITPFGPFSTHTVAPNGYSVYFDGTGDYLTVPSNAAFAFGTGDFTIECWIYYIPGGTAGRFIVDSNNGASFLLRYDAGTTLQFWANSTKKLEQVVTLANTWTHIAVVRSGSDYKLYINGSSVSTGTGSENIANTTAIGIGAIYTGASDYYSGYISNLRIVKGTALYATTFAVPGETLTAVANTSLLTCHTTTLTDVSTNAFTITRNGDARPRTLNPFGETKTVGTPYVPSLYGGSAYFDGSGDYLQFPAGSATAMFGGTLNATRTFTIECWVYHTAYVASTVPVILGDMLPTGGTNYWSFGTNSSGQLVLFWYDGAEKRAIGNTVIALNNWAHIAVSVQAGSIRLFVNGIQQTITGTSTLTSATGSLGYITIGQYNNANVFTGYISNLRVLNGTALYTTAFVPPTSPGLPTTANTSLLLNFTTSGVSDSSGRNVVEAVNDARVVTSIKKYSSGSYYFDGTGDAMVVPVTNSLDILSGDFTVELWVNFASTGGLRAIVAQWNQASNLGGYLFGTTGANLMFYYAPFNTGTALLTSSSTVTTNTWYHIAVTRSGSSFRMFIDGTSVATATSSLTGTPINVNTTLGNYYNSGGTIGATDITYFSGYMDDLRITKGYARYTANFTPPTDRHVPQ